MNVSCKSILVGSPPSIELAIMSQSDVREVAELERRTFSHPWSADLFRRELRLSHSKIVVARGGRGQAIVGYLCRWLTEDALEIQNVAVHVDWRRHSVARRLVEHVLVEAREAGVGRALLEVRRHNNLAVRLYRSMGFREAGLRRRYYADGEDALLMERWEGVP